MIPTQKSDSFSHKLLQWFDQYGRKDLPWQQDKSPYRVWVSEIMLQQTQVTSVINYYQRFMKSFPTLESLAKASEDNVLEHWAGLGYYARARNLHKTAKQICAQHSGIFPDQFDDIVALPGIGRSTAGAILSIAFQKPACILDGNVKRVLCRYHGIDSWPGEKQTENKLWELAEDHTPSVRNDDYTQAIMDLGATCCTRSKPKCTTCPFQRDCVAFKEELTQSLPVSKPKKKIPERETWLALIQHKQHILLEKRPPTGIWGGLYSLPEIDPSLNYENAIEHLEKALSLPLNLEDRDSSIHHTFSHFKLEMKPLKLSLAESTEKAPAIKEPNRFYWHPKSQLHTIGLPAPIAKYLKESTT